MMVPVHVFISVFCLFPIMEVHLVSPFHFKASILEANWERKEDSVLTALSTHKNMKKKQHHRVFIMCVMLNSQTYSFIKSKDRYRAQLRQEYIRPVL